MSTLVSYQTNQASKRRNRQPISNKDLGFPMRRTRFLAALINRNASVWAGPSTAEALLEDFMAVFGCAPVLEASDFVLDTKENHDEILAGLGRQRGLYSPIEALREMPHSSLLAPGVREHWRQYEEIYKTSDRIGAVSGSFVVDFSQNPGERCGAGAWFPALARSSQLYDLATRHFFTNAELDFAMGFPTSFFPGRRSAALAAEIPEALRCHTLPRSAYAKVAGNGMHVASMFCWFAYIFSNTVRRATLQRLILPSFGAPAVQAGSDEDPSDGGNEDSDNNAARSEAQNSSGCSRDVAAET